MTDNSKSYNQTHKAWFSRHAYKTNSSSTYHSEQVVVICVPCVFELFFSVFVFVFYRPNPAVGYHMPNKRVVFVDVVVHDT